MRTLRSTGWLHGVVLLVFLALGEGMTPRGVHALELRGSAEVRHPPLTLRKVVRGTVPEELASLRLGRLPEPGRARFLSRAYILMKARSQNRTEPEFSGDVGRVHVRRPGRKLEPRAIRMQIRDRLRAMYADSAVRFRVRNLPNRLTVLPGSYELRIRPVSGYTTDGPSVWYRVVIRQDDRDIQRLRVRVRRRRPVRVPVVTRSLRRGSSVDRAAVRWAIRDRYTLRGRPLSRAVILRSRARRYIRAGEALTSRNLRPPILVDRNDPVEILVHHGPIRIRTSGRSLEQGVACDRIRVKNSSSRTTVIAEVIGERTVKIREPNNP